MTHSRRDFFNKAIATIGFAGLRRHLSDPVALAENVTPGFGPLTPDSRRTIDLPRGFTYQVISKTGETMDDGFLVPGGHDGMAAFAGPQGRTIIVRNHELAVSDIDRGPFGLQNSLLTKIQPEFLYDVAPGLGGTTTLIYDTHRGKLEQHYLSLAGTVRNCAGGVTPWGSWISCEETVQLTDARHRKDHGYNFEVSANAKGLSVPVPLRAMGRFNHEAVAVDSIRGDVYQTEDRPDGLLYRFVPEIPGKLAAGGKLQALRIVGMEGAHTSNEHSRTIAVGESVSVEWVDLNDVDSPSDDLRMQGFSKGAARFARGEGMWAGNNVIFFVSTAGGPLKAGQVWRYTPGLQGQLHLFAEPNDRSVLDMADNITIAPWGDLILCEDGSESNNVIGITPQGKVYPLVHNAMNGFEFAGATFSRDGSTLFLNIQNPGLTFAITGPWKQRQS
jgi:uncharacterized protein